LRGRQESAAGVHPPGFWHEPRPYSCPAAPPGRIASGLKATLRFAPGRLTGANRRPGPASARSGGLALSLMSRIPPRSFGLCWDKVPRTGVVRATPRAGAGPRGDELSRANCQRPLQVGSSPGPHAMRRVNQLGRGVQWLAGLVSGAAPRSGGMVGCQALRKSTFSIARIASMSRV